MNIGERIKQRRKELKMSAEELAKKLGKDRSTVFRYENGDIENLPIDILDPLADALQTTKTYLMGWEDSPKNRIRELRQAYGIKQIDLAKHLGIAQNTLSYWEQGKYDVDNASLQQIADFFECTVDYVLCRDRIDRFSNSGCFTQKEIELINAYRARPDMQGAVDTLLGLPQGTIGTDAANVIRSGDRTFAGKNITQR